MSNSVLLYLRIPRSLWDKIAQEAEHTGLSFAKAGIAMLERGAACAPAPAGPGVPPQVPDMMV